jgi:hypothetical protein
MPNIRKYKKMSLTDLPDGNGIALQVKKRLDAERKQAASEIAVLLIQQYLAACQDNASASLVVDTTRMGLSSLAAKYRTQDQVMQEIIQLLEEKNWCVKFTSCGYVTITPIAPGVDGEPGSVTDSSGARIVI